MVYVYLCTVIILPSLSPIQVSTLNLNYSDNGLFGMCTVSDGSVTGKVSDSLRAF